MGVICTTMLGWCEKYAWKLYGEKESSFPEMFFVVYDIIFPVFDAEHTYHWRYDIADKVIGRLPNCKTARKESIKNEFELRNFVNTLFTIDLNSSVYVYRTDKKFIPGPSQLLFELDDIASFKVEADQKYRAHVKSITSITERLSNGDKFEIASVIIAKYKKEFIEVPINGNNFALKKYIWDNRKILKGKPFWFTGFTTVHPVGDTSEYHTFINKFLSFIPEDGTI